MHIPLLLDGRRRPLYAQRRYHPAIRGEARRGLHPKRNHRSAHTLRTARWRLRPRQLVPLGGLPVTVHLFLDSPPGTVAGYKLSSEVKSGEMRGEAFVAGVVVSGDFPGSPYEFAYRFKLRGDRIAELAIDPIGSLAP